MSIYSGNNEQIQLKIYGYVQNVFYRVEARDKARALGLTGFVRNEPDGAVFILAEGSRQNLDKFIQWCHKGPRGAKIEKIDIGWKKASGEYDEFEINY